MNAGNYLTRVAIFVNKNKCKLDNPYQHVFFVLERYFKKLYNNLQDFKYMRRSNVNMLVNEKTLDNLIFDNESFKLFCELYYMILEKKVPTISNQALISCLNDLKKVSLHERGINIMNILDKIKIIKIIVELINKILIILVNNNPFVIMDIHGLPKNHKILNRISGNPGCFTLSCGQIHNCPNLVSSCLCKNDTNRVVFILIDEDLDKKIKSNLLSISSISMCSNQIILEEFTYNCMRDINKCCIARYDHKNCYMGCLIYHKIY